MRQQLATQSIVLLGLPGCGKSRLAESLKQQFACQLHGNSIELAQLQTTRPGCFEWQDFLNPPQLSLNQQAWCVIDVRSVLPESSWLESRLVELLTISDGIIFSFVESASLDDQAWWNAWLNQVFATLNKPKPPIVRWLNQQFPADFAGFSQIESTPLQQLNATDNNDKALQIETYRFTVGKIVLDHLLMGLDNSRQNLGMKITRVTAVVETLEYENLVQIEGSAYRWDMFAAEAGIRPGSLAISGVGLDQAWLSELVKACEL